uniref:U-box domain-containing protein n=1 Tax=Aegilops tauschii subsp. strangulata TaxID=200361 RepID=A0A453IIT6_AEGTS
HPHPTQLPATRAQHARSAPSSPSAHPSNHHLAITYPFSSSADRSMALLARRSRRAATKAAAPVAVELSIPAHFRCPISLDLMRDPVTAPTGITYDRESIEAWLDTGRAAVCPVTHAPLRRDDLVPNHAIRRVIQDWCVANRSRGVERIPTP